MTRKPLSWTAKRRGPVYCAPACGYGCTYAAWQLAAQRTHALAKRMGRGWTIHVWENLGWHYHVISPCGRWKLDEGWTYVGERTRYTAFLGRPKSPGGEWVGHGATPRAAMKSAWAPAEAHLKMFAGAGDAIP